MKEIKTIIKAYDGAIGTGAKMALATVVRVEGSSYRRTGARMLVLDNGQWVGGISGGCLEGDALKRSRAAILNSKPTLITYDTTDNDPYQIGVGLGCNGIIDVLFTPLNISDLDNPVEILKKCISFNRETHILLTVTGVAGPSDDAKPGQVIKYDGPESLQQFKDGSLNTNLSQVILERLASGHSAPHLFESGDSKLEIFVEILPPEISLILMGHQYDVYPLSRLVKEMDWHLTIVADPLKLNPAITVLADEVVAPTNFEDIVTDHYTAIVLMAHDYKTDKRNLPRALATKASYIGMLGPRSRSERIWAELEGEGFIIKPEDMERVHAPVGLDIGAVNPEEIALSLMGEVKASLAGRDGMFLRLRQEAIHERR